MVLVGITSISISWLLIYCAILYRHVHDRITNSEINCSLVVRYARKGVLLPGIYVVLTDILLASIVPNAGPYLSYKRPKATEFIKTLLQALRNHGLVCTTCQKAVCDRAQPWECDQEWRASENASLFSSQYTFATKCCHTSPMPC